MLGDEGIDLARPAPLIAESVARPLAGDARDDEDEGHAGGHYQGQADVEDVEHDDRAGHDGKVLDESGQHIGEELAYDFNVAREPGDEASDWLPRKIGERLFYHVPVELEPHVLHDEGPDLVREPCHRKRGEQNPSEDQQQEEGIMSQNRIVSSPDCRGFVRWQRVEQA
ncbi:hypothetical protein SDC9_201686 [bioreactor metagenome]|uniref:Uncharacterized protein n=1 Tax=bioreactor metagenome TaxID=1076179 RepID=A0A645IS12_9ZZZZ